MLYARLTVMTALRLSVKDGEYRWGDYPLRSMDEAQPLTHRSNDSDEARGVILYTCLKEMQGRMAVGVSRFRILAFLRFARGGTTAAIVSLERYTNRLKREEPFVDVRRIIEGHYFATLLLACNAESDQRHIPMLSRLMEMAPYFPHEDAIDAMVDFGYYLRQKELAEELLAIVDAMSCVCNDAWYQFEPLYQYARQATKGEAYYRTALSLGSTLWQAQPAKGIPYYEAILNAYVDFLRQADTVDEPELISTMNKLAYFYEETDQYPSAIRVRTAIYEHHCDMYGSAFEDTVNALRTLALCYYKNGDLEDARQVLEEVYAQQCQLYGDEGYQPAVTMALLTEVCQRLQNPQRRLYWAEKLYDYYAANYGAEDIRTLDVMLMLAEILRDLGRTAEARPMCEKAYACLVATRGEDYYATVRARQLLDSLTET